MEKERFHFIIHNSQNSLVVACDWAPICRQLVISLRVAVVGCLEAELSLIVHASDFFSFYIFSAQ